MVITTEQSRSNSSKQTRSTINQTKMKELTFVVGVHHDTQEPTKEQIDDLHYDILHTLYEKVKSDHTNLKVNQIDVYFASEDTTISVLINK